MTAFVYEWERYLEGKVQILGVSVEPPEEGKKFLERVTRDCQEDRSHIPLDPYPVRLLTDPDAIFSRSLDQGTSLSRRKLVVATETAAVGQDQKY